MPNVNAVFILRFQYEFTGEEGFFGEEEVETEMLFSGKDKTCVICGNIDEEWNGISANCLLLSEGSSDSFDDFERIIIEEESLDGFVNIAIRSIENKYSRIFEGDVDKNFKNSLKSLMSDIVADVYYDDEIYSGVYTGGNISIDEPIGKEYAKNVQFTVSRVVNYIDGGIDIDFSNDDFLKKFLEEGEWADKYEILAICTFNRT